MRVLWGTVSLRISIRFPGRSSFMLLKPVVFPPRPRQGGDEPLRNRIRDARHHDRDRVRSVLGGVGRGAPPCDNHVHLEPDQLVRQVASRSRLPPRSGPQ